MRRIHQLIIALKQPYHIGQGVLAYLLFGLFRRKLTIIGVTGTDGKTTTSTMVYHILRAAGKKVALITTVAAFIGDEEIDTGFHVTSPSPFALHRLLNRIAKKDYTHVVLEVTSHGIHQFRLFGIRPNVAILTNITHEHLDYHGTYERYADVKASFLASARIAIINRTDQSFKRVREYLRKKLTRVIEYDLHKTDPKVRAYLLRRFHETYNRENALAAITACMQMHISTEYCMKGLDIFHGVRGRMEEIANEKNMMVVVDFAHTPNALERALLSLKSRLKPGQRLIAVFGCAGLRDYTKRPMMGKIASELADEAVFTAEDPRTEDVDVIIRQMKEGVVKNWGHMHEMSDRRKAIQFAITRLARPGDIVGIFGKGHERSMNLDGKHELAWSDQDEVKAALSLR